MYTIYVTLNKFGFFLHLQPLLLKYTVLYSNSMLLEKYQKEIPTTWDELITTGKYILEQEKEENGDLIGFNGLFPSKYKLQVNKFLFHTYRFIYI